MRPQTDRALAGYLARDPGPIALAHREHYHKRRQEPSCARAGRSRFKSRMGSDVPGDFLSRSGARVIKAMVGNDLLECEAKNSNFRIRIRGNFNVLVTANTVLHILVDGDQEAWRRRIIRIHFTKPYIGSRIPEISK